jgi:hypothetical protein
MYGMTMTNDLSIDDFVKRIAAKSQHSFANAKSGGRTRVNHISIRQNRFWLVTEDGPTPTPDPLRLQFVLIESKKPITRFYYSAAYDDAASPPPDCMSHDGIVPETDVPAQQAESCATCPKSEWGSSVGIGGAPRAACRIYKQLVVKIPSVQGAWQFAIPAASIVKQWNVYADRIETAAKEEQIKHGFSALTLSTCITEVSFDPKTQGVLNFRALGYIGNRNLMTIEDCEELEKLMDDETLIAKYLWGSEGQKREQQYLAAVGRTKVEAIPIVKPVALAQDVDVPEHGPSRAPDPSADKTSPAPQANSPAIASILSSMGLTLE